SGTGGEAEARSRARPGRLRAGDVRRGRGTRPAERTAPPGASRRRTDSRGARTAAGPDRRRDQGPARADAARALGRHRPQRPDARRRRRPAPWPRPADRARDQPPREDRRRSAHHRRPRRGQGARAAAQAGAPLVCRGLTDPEETTSTMAGRGCGRDRFMRRVYRTAWALGVLLAALVAAPETTARSTDCQPVQAVFYESSDWLRLANGLAANASPCASYYVTIPSLAADKTQMVGNRASVVRALGPNFHALAEVNYTAWSRWVASTGNSWYQAGQEARRRMSAAGFDVSSGDTWAVNEFPSAVRANSGTARQNVRDLVRGLYDGNGGPQVKGIVYVVGVGQNGLSFATYKANLESWLQDTAFWNDMASYVSGFYQETYGDVRNYAVTGVDAPTRAGLLNGFLQHLLSLVTAPNAPASADTARTYLSSAYGPLANASWGWTTAY